MTTFKQFEANRRNSFKSTGPTTEAGKQRSRRNALRHGLTAETVIGGLEDEEDYKAFELSVSSGFDAPTAVERELVLRLASLLWRLRRATAIETGLLQLQSNIIGALKQSRDAQERIGQPALNEAFICSDRRPGVNRETEQNENLGSLALNYIGTSSPDGADQRSSSPNSEIARCFLRLANFDNGAFDRANRYETALWRQVGQTLLTLDFLRRTGGGHGIEPLREPT
jgi:hypothetical protein